MNYSQHIQDKANRLVAKGSKMTFDQICEMLVGMENKQNKKIAKSEGKWQQRELVANTKASENPSEWLAAKNRENAFKSRPSSMR